MGEVTVLTAASWRFPRKCEICDQRHRQAGSYCARCQELMDRGLGREAVKPLVDTLRRYLRSAVVRKDDP